MSTENLEKIQKYRALISISRNRMSFSHSMFKITEIQVLWKLIFLLTKTSVVRRWISQKWWSKKPMLCKEKSTPSVCWFIRSIWPSIPSAQNVSSSLPTDYYFDKRILKLLIKNILLFRIILFFYLVIVYWP